MKKTAYLLLISSLFLYSCANKTITGNSSAKSSPAQKEGKRAEILFLGHKSEHHHSDKYAPILAMALFKDGINITYTTDRNDLNAENLDKYDGLVIYANHDSITAPQEKSLIAFVEGGKGLIPLHCASACFKNSDWYIKAVGGAFKSHATGDFTAKITNTSHPVMQGLTEFETWDETYVHSNLNPDKTILMERVEGTTREPWTWVRNQGKGRVFYTAYGHDERTWDQPGFQKLVENGILWAIGDEAREQVNNFNIPKGVYVDAKIPNYEKREPEPKFQQAFSAAQSQKLMQVPVGFEIELFAAEPDVINPITMAWDEKGRLWVVETVDYPNTIREEDGMGDDRIKICEDTDGDGKADKFNVFADSLNIPTSMVFVNGGVVISQAPHFLFLKDTNGDDKADVREIIITGWGKSDTHAGPSNLKYGFDNKLWGVLGYSGFKGEVGGKPMSFGQGVYSFTADGKSLDFLGRTSNNTWGLGFSEENDVFISTANNTHSAYFSLPGNYMKRTLARSNVQPVKKIDGHYDMHVVFPNLRQVDVFGGFTAAAGHNLYTARNYPKEYWNRIAFVCEPTGRVVHNAILEQDGAGFTEKDGWNFLASSDEWAGPVHAEVGPDGAVWIADWYDFIIQHNPTPRGFENGEGNAYINPLRDSEHGRIYKIKYKNAKPYKPLKLAKDDTQGLLKALENDNMFWRMTAQRLLVEAKDQKAIPGLIKLVNDQKVDEIGLNSPAIHALWTLHGIGALSGSNAEALQAAVKALSHPAAGVRKAALEVLPKDEKTSEIIQKSNLLNDQDMRVRMVAMAVLSDLPASETAGKLVYESSLIPENGKDEFVSQALFAAAITHQKGFLASSPKNSTASMPDSALSLNEKISRGMDEESYKLDRWSQLMYPPDVTGKEIIITASGEKGEKLLEGVIMVQGGKQNGYGLFIRDGQMNMVVNQNGKSYKAVSAKTVPDKFDVVGRLNANGSFTVNVNGGQVAEGKAPSLFKKPLTQSAVRVGADYGSEDKVGNYEGDFPYQGKDNFKNASLVLARPGKGTASVAKTKSGAASTDKQEVANSGAVTTITITVVENMMKFDKKQVTVKAGQKVVINFENPDFMQHNLVVIKPGTLDKVGAAADVLARDPKGADKEYIPAIPEVLYATKLLNPEETVKLEFTAPATPGDYPFVCTFPGHWRMMNGIMKVVK